jgi:regulator of sigma E protease
VQNMAILAINAGNVAMQVFYLILSLSILVVLHEFGHYITARWFKCRVEKFYLFFDPWFSIVKKKIGDTEYGIGWLPLGGYVKISGMIDESMDKEAMQLPPKDYEFRSKPAWQRLIIMLGGIIMNVLLAFAIYAMILFVWGQKRMPISSVKNGIWIQDSVLYKYHLLNGDKIIAIDGKPVQYFEDIPPNLLLAKNVTIDRAGVQSVLTLPENFVGQSIESRGKGSQGLSLLSPRIPTYVGDVSDTSLGGNKVGLHFLDKIVSIDSIPVTYFDEMATILATKKKQKVNLLIERKGTRLTLPASIDEDGKIGIPTLSPDQYDSLGVYKIITRKYGFFAAIPAGVGMAVDRLENYVGQFKLILNPKSGAAKGLSGFKGIASNFPTQWGDWETFWLLTGFLSIALAFMNLLPIPALDGGHVLFTLYEIITGRKPSEKFLEYAQIVGMVLLLSLMLYANGNDWFGWGRGR